MEALGIPFEMLPAVKKPGEVIGRVAAETPFGLLPGAPVFVPIGDHPSSVFTALAQRQDFSLAGVSNLDTNVSCASAQRESSKHTPAIDVNVLRVCVLAIQW